nr:hypothetical protein [Nocardioides convexus]
MPVIGVAIAIPEPWATESLRLPAADRRPHRGRRTEPHHADPADLGRGGPERDRGAGSPTRPPRSRPSRCTCAARPPSGPSRRWSSSAWPRGSRSASRLAGEVRRGPLAVDLDYPYHPHVTVAHHLDDPTLDRAFEEPGGFRVPIRGN